MNTYSASTPRGLTLPELLIATVVTAMIGLAIASMMAAVSNGVTVRRDSRSNVLLGNAVHARLGGYIIGAQCVLDIEETLVTIWVDDTREGGTVHGSELRWIEYNADAGTLDVHVLSLPVYWSDLQRERTDQQHRMDSNWASVLQKYDDAGHISTIRIADSLASFKVTGDQVAAIDSSVFGIALGFEGEQLAGGLRATYAIRNHEAPTQ